MSKIITNEIFQKEIQDLINPDLELLGTYVDSKTKIPCKCKKCRYEWAMLPGNIKKGRGCPKCAYKNKGDIRNNLAKIKNQEKLIKISKEKNYILLSDYIDAKTKIKCKCNICGYEWETFPGNLLKSQGCYICGRKSTSEKLRKNSKQFEKELHSINNNLILLNEYINQNTKIKIQCKKCDHIWEAYPSNLLKGRGCPKCSQSKGEESVEKYLKLNNIKYISQYEIQIDKNINFSGKAYIDFYLPEYNLFIEYNGKQHYVPLEYFGGQITFEHQVARDNYIKEYCDLHNINLLEISYKEFNDINNILKSNLKMKVV